MPCITDELCGIDTDNVISDDETEVKRCFANCQSELNYLTAHAELEFKLVLLQSSYSI